MAEVVTGDAVVLDVQIAQLPVRAVGALIDIAVVFVGYLLALMLWAATLTQFDDAATAAILVIFTVLVLVGYPLVFETATRALARQDRDGLRVVPTTAAGTLPAGAVSGSGVGGGDLDALG
ncbi:putative integral membrane protein [Mycobacterium xenopi 4042]|uniref:Putative integral membrane protein n=1 Tax=Mycobacterium xenopi 4042 TaxID=1299334 RepID=X8EFI9_MYCXE|nr:putative integral membrane protein [Mycobacterium xenopi 4042]